MNNNEEDRLTGPEIVYHLLTHDFQSLLLTIMACILAALGAHCLVNLRIQSVRRMKKVLEHRVERCTHTKKP